ncbi:MAG: hypothetical protein MUF77_09495 [Leptospira sp.]|jgi:hypothetical protein|nr:hypothetical protein [Leptospira sp.]
MSGIYEYFQKIQIQIIEIKDSLIQIKQSWESLQKAWDLFFTIVPWEVLLLLIFSVILLSIFNSISPSSPKLNLTFAVVLLSFLWSYFWGLFSESVSYTKVIWTSLYILIPLHFFGILQIAIQYSKKVYWNRRRIQPRDWDSALHQLSQDYHELMSKAHLFHASIEENRSGILEGIHRMEKTILGLKTLTNPNQKE